MIKKQFWLILAQIKMMNKKKILLIAGILVILLIIIIKDTKKPVVYYYIDWDNNRGVATQCWENKESGLFCDRGYGGKIAVKQYWRAS